jgi:hypothetical protein
MRSRSRRISLVCATSPLGPRDVLLTLASSQWLTVLPQVVSRILHTNAEVLDVLEIILKRVLASYPHHGYWAMASGAKSTTARRSKRNMRVFAKAKVRIPLPRVSPVIGADLLSLSTVGGGRPRQAPRRDQPPRRRGPQVGRAAARTLQLRHQREDRLAQSEEDFPQPPKDLPDEAHHPAPELSHGLSALRSVASRDAQAVPRQPSNFPRSVPSPSPASCHD